MTFICMGYIDSCQMGQSILKQRPNYKLHPLSLVKVQSSPLSFDRFNLVI